MHLDFHECSEASGRNANRVVLYEDASKKQLQEFILALRGCEQMAQACFSLGVILSHVKSRQLHHLLTPGTVVSLNFIKLFWSCCLMYCMLSIAGKVLPDVCMDLNHFKDAFDWAEANNSGRIIPREGVDTV